VNTVRRLPYGYRGKLGLIVVGTNPTPREDIGRIVPDGVLVLETRVLLKAPRAELNVVRRLSADLPEAAAVLAQGKVNAIAVACTSGTVSGGPGHEEQEIHEMQEASGGIPCTTVASSVLNAMRVMGWRRIVVASPYIDEINDAFRIYFPAKGFEVLHIEALSIRDAYELGDVPPHKVYSLVKSAARKEADGIFVPCTTFPAIDIIDEAERDTKKPILTSNQALAWELLRLIGLDEPISGFGRLLQLENRTSYMIDKQSIDPAIPRSYASV
jgi:maleate isomerase